MKNLNFEEYNSEETKKVIQDSAEFKPYQLRKCKYLKSFGNLSLDTSVPVEHDRINLPLAQKEVIKTKMETLNHKERLILKLFYIFWTLFFFLRSMNRKINQFFQLKRKRYTSVETEEESLNEFGDFDPVLQSFTSSYKLVAPFASIFSMRLRELLLLHGSISQRICLKNKPHRMFTAYYKHEEPSYLSTEAIFEISAGANLSFSSEPFSVLESPSSSMSSPIQTLEWTEEGFQTVFDSSVSYSSMGFVQKKVNFLLMFEDEEYDEKELLSFIYNLLDSEQVEAVLTIKTSEFDFFRVTDTIKDLINVVVIGLQSASRLCVQLSEVSPVVSSVVLVSPGNIKLGIKRALVLVGAGESYSESIVDLKVQSNVIGDERVSIRVEETSLPSVALYTTYLQVALENTHLIVDFSVQTLSKTL
eukprot:augustus_masked-scaffold_13-processed-gene-4.11-mRNA-1 protein AED:1.00 eAED:1.00 QI:0/-1/0/0/-1/1/1/0/417